MSVNTVDSILLSLKLRYHIHFEVITFNDNVVSCVITVTFLCPHIAASLVCLNVTVR